MYKFVMAGFLVLVSTVCASASGFECVWESEDGGKRGRFTFQTADLKLVVAQLPVGKKAKVLCSGENEQQTIIVLRSDKQHYLAEVQGRLGPFPY